MHELAITQSLFKIVLEQAQKAGATKVTRINLKIGRLTGYVPEAVEMNFNLLASGTMAEGAGLKIEWAPVKVHCRDCQKESERQDLGLGCAHCGSLNVRIAGGREMYIESMEVDNG
ncbi:hydrogenase maturation nickel metallochaperone HypA [candidate division TA06 bacterium]|uniref:Hydrogenase maturation factor HypA n=1 Tax=candidate division TA06 bacterium TaxID=2250710 RepID=A0A933I922_UNCT6|nr:hydrogenase maturation nickel metallochaperone HypA [candidate division TA06 bacterium]